MKKYTRQQAIEKIIKLLAVADEAGNAGEAERETAMRHATRFLDEFALSLADVADHVHLCDDPVGRDVACMKVAWRHAVVDAIGWLYGCKVYTSAQRSKVNVVGRESARATVFALANWVIESIHQESLRAYRGDRRGQNSFRLGAGQGVWKTARAIAAERKEDHQSDGKALVLADYYQCGRKMATNWLAGEGVSLRSRRESSTVSSLGAFGSGKVYGGSLSLSRQVRGNTVRRIK